MKNDYEDEVYQFFTRPDNFETMVAVAAHTDTVTNRIIREFWDSLKLRLDETFRRKGEGWQVGYSGNFTERYCKLWVYRAAWLTTPNYPLVSVAFEDLHYGEYPFVGIHLNIDQEVYDPGLLKERIGTPPNLSLENSNNAYWIGRRYFPFNFTQQKNLVEILPDCRVAIIDNLVTEAVTIADGLTPVVDEIIEKSKINP
ncbi:MAG: hypothetical protein WA960_18435 [Tunicatimonas sp.]